MKLLVFGTRTLPKPYPYYISLLDKAIHKHKLNVSHIVCGTAYGGDKVGELYARRNNIPIIYHRPDWSKYGKSAGPIRNKLLVSDADYFVCFWDGQSTGTFDTLSMLIRKNTKGLLFLHGAIKYPLPAPAHHTGI